MTSITAPITLEDDSIQAPIIEDANPLVSSDITLTKVVTLPIQTTVEGPSGPVNLTRQEVNAPIGIGLRGPPGPPGPPAVIFMEFADETERDLYFSAHPEDLSDQILIAITGEPNGEGFTVYTHSGDFTIPDGELNAVHVFTASATVTLPLSTGNGRWVRCKKNSEFYLRCRPSGSDTLAGNTQFDDEFTDLYDFVDFVSEEAGVWAIHDTRGNWVGV